jgi:hypothetical protein
MGHLPEDNTVHDALAENKRRLRAWSTTLLVMSALLLMPVLYGPLAVPILIMGTDDPAMSKCGLDTIFIISVGWMFLNSFLNIATVVISILVSASCIHRVRLNPPTVHIQARIAPACSYCPC